MGYQTALRRILPDHVHPAVAALGSEIRLAVGVVVFPRTAVTECWLLLVDIGDVDVETAAVKGVVIPRIHHEIQALILCYSQVIDGKLRQRFLRSTDLYDLQLQQLFSLVDHQLHAVRIAWIGVAVHILHIGDSDIDSAIFRCAPLQNGRCLLRCMKKRLLDLQPVDPRLNVFLPIEPGNLLRSVGPLRIAVAIEPSVGSLFAEVLYVKCVVCPAGHIIKRRFLIGIRRKGRGPERIDKSRLLCLPPKLRGLLRTSGLFRPACSAAGHGKSSNQRSREHAVYCRMSQFFQHRCHILH